MSADRENHDMTQTDIALLLADAADEVEIGIAPVQAVMSAGRRRRARRWAVAAATAVVLAGSTGATLAVTGLPGGGRHDKGATVATQGRHADRPHLTEVARGTDHGTGWRVEISVWDPPRDKAEADRQLEAMRRYGIDARVLPERSHLVGMTSHYASLYYGDEPLRPIMFDTGERRDYVAGSAAVIPLAGKNVDGALRLVVGTVDKTARQVRLTWKNGDSTVVLPHAAAGSPVDYFVGVAPAGTSYLTSKVIM